MNSTIRKILVFPAIIAAIGVFFSAAMVMGMGATQFGDVGMIITSGPTTGMASLIMSCGLFMIFLGIVIYNLGFLQRLSVLWLSFFSVSIGLWIFVDYQGDIFIDRYGRVGNLMMLYLLSAALIFLDIYLSYSIGGFLINIHVFATYLFAFLMILAFLSVNFDFYYGNMVYTVMNYLVAVNLIMNCECLFISFKQTGDHSTLAVFISLCISIFFIVIDMMMYRSNSPFAAIISPAACVYFLFHQMYLCFRSINKNLVSEREKEELEKERLQNQMSTLYTQIQPHFIFNVLNTIGDLCITDPMEAENAVIMFSKYLRTNISFMDGTEMVRFMEEMETVKNYYELERLRFGDMVNLETDLKVVDFDLPLLSLQPLVENCIKHGLRPQRGGGTVVITSYEDNQHYYVIVSDDGVGFDTDLLQSKEGSVGIKNVARRIELYAKGSLDIHSMIGQGSSFRITIPK